MNIYVKIKTNLKIFVLKLINKHITYYSKFLQQIERYLQHLKKVSTLYG